jgi:hypothetical protein
MCLWGLVCGTKTLENTYHVRMRTVDGSGGLDVAAIVNECVDMEHINMKILETYGFTRVGC